MKRWKTASLCPRRSGSASNLVWKTGLWGSSLPKRHMVRVYHVNGQDTLKWLSDLPRRQIGSDSEFINTRNVKRVWVIISQSQNFFVAKLYWGKHSGNKSIVLQLGGLKIYTYLLFSPDRALTRYNSQHDKFITWQIPVKSGDWYHKGRAIEAYYTAVSISRTDFGESRIT